MASQSIAESIRRSKLDHGDYEMRRREKIFGSSLPRVIKARLLASPVLSVISEDHSISRRRSV